MSDKTAFAGLEVLLAGEPLSTDGYRFTTVDRYIIDRILKVGAVTHRHDGHAALANPTAAPTVTTEPGGAIPSGFTIHVTYTLIDQDGGESLPVAAQSATTPGGFTNPVLAPTAVVSYGAGSLLADNYTYAVTVEDGLGGETAISPAAQATVLSGYPNGEVTISGLAGILSAASSGGAGAQWRLWRMQGGGPWFLIDTGTTNTTVDTGAPGDCTVAPPNVNTTRGNASLHVTVPSAGQPAGAVIFNIYASLDGSFGNPSLLASLPIAQFGITQVYTDLLIATGSPPSVSTCLPGANPITGADLALNWLAPVANAAALPSTGNHTGDARVALDGPTIQIWSGTSWDAISGGGGGGGGGGGTMDLGIVRVDGPIDTPIVASDTTEVTIPAPPSGWPELEAYRLVVALNITHAQTEGLQLTLNDASFSNTRLVSTGTAVGVGWGGTPATNPDNYIMFSEMVKGRMNWENDSMQAVEPLVAGGVSTILRTNNSYRPEASFSHIWGDATGPLTLEIIESSGNAGVLHGVVVWYISPFWEALMTIPSPLVMKQQGTSFSSDYTLNANDFVGNQGPLLGNSPSAMNLTIPVLMNRYAGCRIRVIQTNVGQVTIIPQSGVTIYSKGAAPAAPKISAQYGAVELYQAVGGVWYVTGDVV